MRKKDDIWERFPALKSIPEDKFPHPVLIIPDGNGRWAERLHKIPIFGHKQGAIVLKKVIRTLQELPIDTLTVWGFSADNWSRSNREIKGLMEIFEKSILEMHDELMGKNIRFIHLGRKDRVPTSLRKIIEQTENMTLGNTGQKFCTAIDFGGQDQELRIMKTIQKLPKKTNVTLELLENLRDGGGIIKPADLIIRTSGEQRTSDIGWLSQNAEFYAIKNFLPETGTEDFVKAFADYSKRERRFGGRPSQWS